MRVRNPTMHQQTPPPTFGLAVLRQISDTGWVYKNFCLLIMCLGTWVCFRYFLKFCIQKWCKRSSVTDPVGWQLTLTSLWCYVYILIRGTLSHIKIMLVGNKKTRKNRLFGIKNGVLLTSITMKGLIKRHDENGRSLQGQSTLWEKMVLISCDFFSTLVCHGSVVLIKILKFSWELLATGILFSHCFQHPLGGPWWVNLLKTSPLGFFNNIPRGAGPVNMGLGSWPRVDLGVADMGNSHHAISGILPWCFPPSILSRGMLKHGKWVSLLSRSTPGFPPGTPSHQIILGGYLLCRLDFMARSVSLLL